MVFETTLPDSSETTPFGAVTAKYSADIRGVNSPHTQCRRERIMVLNRWSNGSMPHRMELLAYPMDLAFQV